MNLKTTFVLLALAVVLGLLGLWRLSTTGPGGGGGGPALPGAGGRTAADAGEPVLDPAAFDPDAVERITLARLDETDLVFEKREGDRWFQVEPVEFRMQTWAIRGLATAAADLIVEESIPVRELDEDLSAADLGLEPPRAVLTLEDDEGNTFTLRLGRIYVGGKAYVRRAAEGPVLVVPDALHVRVLRRDPEQWREKDVFDEAGQEMSRIRITRGTGAGGPFGSGAAEADESRVVAPGRMRTRWSMSEPWQARVDQAAVSNLVSRLSGASLRGFVADEPEDLARYGLSDPADVIAIEIDRPTAEADIETDRQVLQLGHPLDLEDRTRYAKRADRPVVFTIAGPTVDAMLPDPLGLVSKRIVEIPAADVRSVEVRPAAGAPFRLERTVDDWQVADLPGPDDARDDASEDDAPAPAPAATPGDRIAIEGLLGRLTATATSVEPGTVEEPLVTYTLRNFGDDVVARIAVGRRSIERSAAGEDGTESTMVIEEILFDDGGPLLRVEVDASLPETRRETFEQPEGGAGEPDPSK